MGVSNEVGIPVMMVRGTLEMCVLESWDIRYSGWALRWSLSD